jgi:membrane-associated phospholipid phosphatase
VPSDSPSTRALAFRCSLLALGWIGLTVALFGIGEFVVHSHTVTDLDRRVTDWVVGHRTPALDTAMRLLTWIGSWVTVAVTGGVVLVLVLTKHLARAVLLAFAVAWAGEYATVNIVKHAVGRPRPPRELWLVTAHGGSFPSGHAANATLVCAAATTVAYLLSRRHAVRTTTSALAGVAIVVVGYSRVELGVHWTTDVLGGTLVAVVWLAAVAGLFADRSSWGRASGNREPTNPSPDGPPSGPAGPRS